MAKTMKEIEIKRLAIANGWLVTANEDGTVPLNSKVIAESFAELAENAPGVATLMCQAPMLLADMEEAYQWLSEGAPVAAEESLRKALSRARP